MVNIERPHKLDEIFIQEPGTTKSVFLTFGDGGRRYRLAAERLVKSAQKSGFFTSVISLDLADIQRFSGVHRADKDFIISNSSRGFGYWLWKPLLINEFIRLSPSGTRILYVDAGCELNLRTAHAMKELDDCWRIAEQQGIGLVQSSYLAYEYTKTDIFKELEWQPNSTEYQYAATVLYAVANDKSATLVNEWLRLCRLDKYRLIDNSNSVYSVDTFLVENRFDQSILSALYQKMQLVPLHSEIFFGSGYWSWRRMGRGNFIWASRNTRGLPRFAWPRCLAIFGWIRFRIERVSYRLSGVLSRRSPGD